MSDDEVIVTIDQFRADPNAMAQLARFHTVVVVDGRGAKQLTVSRRDDTVRMVASEDAE